MPNMITEMRERMNEANLLPWISKSTPRLYMYSDVDMMVPAIAVEDHIAAATAKGLVVRAEFFHGTPHVSHVRQDPERYWGAVRKVWAEAVKTHMLQSYN